MRSVLLVISLLFVSGGCYHLLIVENLRIEFLKLHSEIVKSVSNNDTLRHDIRLILHDYKPFLIRLKKVEQDVLNYDFIINSNKLNNNIRNHFESIYNTTININSKKRYNENNFKDGIKRFNYTRILQDFRNKTNKQTYFYSFLEKIDKTTLEQYSKHELCFILYQYLTLTDIKGLILTSLFEFTTNNSSIPLKLPPVAKYNNILLSLGNIPDDIWRQDPANHKKGKTYIEIEKFLQAVIVYEKHMYPFNCKNECIDYKNVTSIKNDCGQQFNEMAFNCKSIVDTYHRTQLLNCHEVSPTLTTCRDTFPRIYKYSKFGNQIYGDNSGCTQKEQTFTTNKGCSYCVCTMYYKRYSAKYISLRSVTSTIDKNRIIVGARFQKHNNLIHIQIKEGILGPYLTINETRWVKIENFKYNDRLIHQNQDFIQISMNKRSIHLGAAKLSHVDDKYINIENYVLTGVRFHEWQGFLLLQIRCTRFDLKSGALIANGSGWYDVNSWPSNEIEINNSDIPRDGGTSKIVSRGDNQFVSFTHSSFETDFAQTTVPFFDAQEVVSSSPLHGMGIYYKRELKNGNRKSGGFLGIKLFTYDYKDHLRKLTN